MELENIKDKDDITQEASVTLIADTGIQFVEYEIDLNSEELSKFDSFYFRRSDSSPVMCLYTTKDNLPRSSESNDLDKDKVYLFTSPYIDSNSLKKDQMKNYGKKISMEDAFEFFANYDAFNEWIPMTFFRNAISDGNEPVWHYKGLFWSRAYIKKVTDKKYKIVYAFDTKSSTDVNTATKSGLFKKDLDNGGLKFSICHDFKLIQNFLLEDSISSWLKGFTNRYYLREDHLAKIKEPDWADIAYQMYYQVLIFVLGFDKIKKFPVINVKSFFKDSPNKLVKVNAMIDIGNSRTSILLSEEQENKALGDMVKFEVQDLTDPTITYEEAFPTRVEFAYPSFSNTKEYPFDNECSALKLFQWPSMVRTGFEAEHLYWLLDGSEGDSGLSSPKRYLWSDRPVDRCWRLNIKNRISSVLQDEESALVAPYASYISDDGVALFLNDEKSEAFDSKYSRKSTMTFMIGEILAQIVRQINSIKYRNKRSNKDAPRALSRIILTVPPAMPKQEIERFRECVQSAVGIFWKIMNWDKSEDVYFAPNFKNLNSDENENIFPPIPKIDIEWDEAICGQMVYLYNEVNETFNGNFEDFCSNCSRNSNPLKVTLATIDIGGGTSDIVINSYEQEPSTKEIWPKQLFRESFKIAGDDILLKVVQEYVLSSILKYAKQESKVEDCEDELANRLRIYFGPDNMELPDIQSKTNRKQATLQLFVPVAIKILSSYEKYNTKAFEDINDLTFGQIIASFGNLYKVSAGVQEYINSAFRDVIQNPNFDVLKTPLKIRFEKLHRDFSTVSTFDICEKVFTFMAEVIEKFDCDEVIITGRPSRYPGILDCFKNLLKMSKARIMTLGSCFMHGWNPFVNAHGNISDPKYTAALGANILSACHDRKIETFLVKTGGIKIRSCIRYLGQLDKDKVTLKNNNVYLKDVDLDSDNYQPKEDETFILSGPKTLGYRSMKIERWPAAPLYVIKMSTQLSNAISQASKEDKLPVVKICRVKNEDRDGSDPMNNNKFSHHELELQIVGKTQFKDIDIEIGPDRDIEMSLCTMPEIDGSNMHWLDTGSVVRNG